MSDGTSKFSIKEALSYGWTTFKAKPMFFVLLTLILAAITGIPDLIARALFEPRSGAITVVSIMLWFVSLALSIATIRIALDFYDQGDADLSALTPTIASRYVHYFLGKLLYIVIIFVGFLLLIVPGVILSMMLYFVGFLIVDRQLGPIEALKESKAITDGAKWKLLGFSLIVGLINLGGFLLLLVGLLVTVPVSLLAWVYVYRQLSPKQEAIAA